VALNMVEEAHAQGLDIDAEALSRALGVPVIPTYIHRARAWRSWRTRSSARGSSSPG